MRSPHAYNRAFHARGNARDGELRSSSCRATASEFASKLDKPPVPHPSTIAAVIPVGTGVLDGPPYKRQPAASIFLCARTARGIFETDGTPAS